MLRSATLIRPLKTLRKNWRLGGFFRDFARAEWGGTDGGEWGGTDGGDGLFGRSGGPVRHPEGQKVTPEGIESEESLAAWLGTLPNGTAAERDGAHRLAVAVAHRAAMRVLPIALGTESERSAAKHSVEVIGIFRLNLIAGVSARHPRPEARAKAADLAAVLKSFDSDLTAPSKAKHAAVEAMSVVTAADAASPKSSAAVAAKTAAFAYALFAYGPDSYGLGAAASADAAETSMWLAVQADCEIGGAGQTLNNMPLWPEGSSPADPWSGIREDLRTQEQDWSFWIAWYEKALAGDPQDWGGLLTEVALIPSEDWEKGADHVNALIAEIRARYAVENSYNSERVVRDPDDQLFRAEPITDLPERVLRDAINRVRDVVAEVRTEMGRSNVYAALLPDLDRIDDYLSRYSDSPLRLHEVLTKSLRHVETLITEGSCPAGNMLVEDYRADLDSSAIDIRESDAEVRRTLTLRARVRFERLEPEEEAGLRSVVDVARAESKPQFGEELRADLETTTDDSASEANKDESRFRLGGRLLRISQVVRKEAVSAADDVTKLQKGAQAVNPLWDWCFTHISGWFT